MFEPEVMHILDRGMDGAQVASVEVVGFADCMVLHSYCIDELDGRSPRVAYVIERTVQATQVIVNTVLVA